MNTDQQAFCSRVNLSFKISLSKIEIKAKGSKAIYEDKTRKFESYIGILLKEFENENKGQIDNLKKLTTQDDTQTRLKYLFKPFQNAYKRLNDLYDESSKDLSKEYENENENLEEIFNESFKELDKFYTNRSETIMNVYHQNQKKELLNWYNEQKMSCKICYQRCKLNMEKIYFEKKKLLNNVELTNQLPKDKSCTIS